ncbi:MAG: endonuclease/exonuclease/phosphatase family protein [Victivallaceae bacterium]|nr:endonuclease/exonuclease/phosphatase family protein [Victivallaceae bacterium]
MSFFNQFFRAFSGIFRHFIRRPLVIMSYNLRTGGVARENDAAKGLNWDVRLPAVLEMLNRHHPHLVGTQELRDYQLNEILQSTNYQSVGIARNGRLSGDEFTAILYDPLRLGLISSGTFWLSQTPGTPSVGYDARFPRIATWGVFLDRKTGKKIAFYNTHLDHIGAIARQEGVKMIVRHAEKSAAHLPLVLTGDFNAIPGTPTYRTATSCLRDAREVSAKSGGAQYTFHGFRDIPAGRSGAVLDYIFVSPQVNVLWHYVDVYKPKGVFPSDHAPLIAKITLP